VPPLIVELTVVAYGTSAPEIVVGVQAGWSGHGDIAFGNVLGSNIANLGLILGITALLRPAPVPRTLARLEVPVLVIATGLLALLLLDGHISRPEAAFLLGAAVVYSVWMVLRAKDDRNLALDMEVTEAAAETVGAPHGGSIPRLAFLVLAGLGMLVLGGNRVVLGASRFAAAMGMSERIIGLTIVTVGTSIPELATSAVAAWRGHTDMAVGNVVGSNIFNILLA
jgi:cation:H+ antiporter